jgi:hypothetical protein
VICGRLPWCTATIIGSGLLLTLTLSASAGTGHANAHPDLDKTEACIRAALHKEKLAIKYIQEGKIAKATIADKVIEPATTDIFTCAAHALNAAEAADEISKDDAKAVDTDITDAAAGDDDARHFLAERKGKSAIASLEKANSLKEAALSFIEHAAGRQPRPTVSPIYAVFLPKKLATKYSIRAFSNDSVADSYRWTLTLQQIDPDKSSPPGFQSSDPSAPNYASAGFDPKCNNSLLPNGKQTSATGSKAVYVWTDQLDAFTWYHGDVGSYPGSSYGCDHTKMGARGHQGIVAVVITDGRWVCTASIDGTNLTEQTEHGDKPVCVYHP